MDDVVPRASTGEPTEISEATVRRNALRSSPFIAFAFITNAVANLALIGWLQRLGGFALVGTWSLLNALVVFMLVADGGLSLALTREVSIRGVTRSWPTHRWLLTRSTLALLAMLPLGLTIAWLTELPAKVVGGWACALLAGALQVMSGWAVTVRLGQHEQYWRNVATILRVLTQSTLVVVLLSVTVWDNKFSMGAALLAGALAEVSLIVGLLVAVDGAKIRAARHIPSPSFREVVALTKGFGATKFLQALLEPLTRGLVGVVAGTPALGAFTVSWRPASLLRSIVSEVLRVLLPGISRLHHDGNREATLAIVRDSVLVQALITVPACLFAAINAQAALELWLGTVPLAAVHACQIFLAALALSSWSVPYFWALQAVGDASFTAVATLARLLLTLVPGAAALWWFEGDIRAFAICASVGILVAAVSYLLRADRRWALLSPILHDIRWVRTATVTGLSVLLALATANVPTAWIPSTASLLLGGTVYAVLLVALPLLLMQGGHFTRSSEGRNRNEHIEE
ncbi:MAG: hypothetical protein AAGA68_01415 [Pseudomonadota bacterium]